MKSLSEKSVPVCAEPRSNLRHLRKQQPARPTGRRATSTWRWRFFDDRTNPLGVSITFLDVTHLGKLKDELRRAREEIQTATEALQASNEELETTNEELQSTNEELETMR